MNIRMPNYLLALSLCLYSLASVAQVPMGYQIGDVVSDFSLMSTEKQMVSMADFPETKGFIVIVSCNTCPWVHRYEQRIINLHNKFADKGYPVIAINPNDVNRSPGDSFEAMKARAAEKQFPFTYLHDQTQEIAEAFGATYTPEVYVLEKTDQGLILQYHGAIDDSPRSAKEVEEKFVEEAIESLLSGKPVERSRAKGIGCSVKYKA